nr:LOW QUALITY PROTEIN: zonadhesin [Cavia porcellus]
MAVLAQCDFEDNSKPLCEWSQVSADNGDWTRTRGLARASTSGPPGGFPNGEGYYLRMESGSFPRGGVARLLSPMLWESGPLCLRFAYHMFGLSSGSQLRLLLLTGSQNTQPTVLWKVENTQSPSWMPTAVTIPVELALPSQLIFEGMRGSTAYLDISLDSISIHRGTCNRVCVMQTCSFDIPDDLCGWSWVPTASGAKWSQWKGPSGKPGVGPNDDFSSPGSGFYMLLDPKYAKPGQKSVLLSPLSHSTGCLTLSFHYTLWGQAPGAALLVYGSVSGSIRKHTLFSGQPGSNWQPVSVNYTGQGQIEFSVVGVFGETPEPAVAVDEVSIAPCEESFPQCDFEDSAYPFCDWRHTLGDSGQWAWGSENMSTRGVGSFGEALFGGEHYVYLDTDRSSQEGQLARLVSRPFCAPGNVCVEFSYHMYGLGYGATLRLLLQSPAGSTPIPLWERIGPQKPNWLNASVTIPSGHQQPMQLILEAIRGSNAAFVVAVSFIFISQRALPTAVLPTTSPMEKSEKPTVLTEEPTVPAKEITVRMEGLAISTKESTVPTGKPAIRTEWTTILTEKLTIPTEWTTVPTVKPTIPTEGATVPTEKPAISAVETPTPTEKPTIPTEGTTILTEKSTIPTEGITTPTEKPTISTEGSTIPTEKPTIPTEGSTIPTEKPAIPTEGTTVPTEKPAIPTEGTTIPTEKPIIPTEGSTVSTEEPTIPTEGITTTTEKPTIPTEGSPIPTEGTTVPTEKPTIPTEGTTVPTEKPTIPTEGTTVPTEEPTIPPEEPTIPTEGTTIPTEGTTVPTEKPTIPTEGTTVPTEEPTIPPEEPTIPTEEPTIPTEEPTIPTEEPTIPTESITIPTEKPTIPTEGSTIPTEGTTIPTEKPTIATEGITIPTEEPTISTEGTTIPTEKSTITIEGTTIPTEETTIPIEETTIPTEETTVLTEVTTVSTEKPTIPTEGATVSTEKPTIPTEVSTIPTEWSTVSSEKTLNAEETSKDLSSTEKPIVTIEKTKACLLSCSTSTFLPTEPTALMMPLEASGASMTNNIPAITTNPAPTTANCPPNAHYESCACPVSCENPKPRCMLPCHPGCVCNRGFLLSARRCIKASSCNCIYGNKRYKPGQKWFGPNCTKYCSCWPGNRMKCQRARCGIHSVCRLKDNKYGCYPYDTATCFVYGDPHYVTFDKRQIGFTGKCTYILAQPCNSTEPFFRVTAKNEERGQEGVTCLSKVSVTLPETTVTLLKGRQTLVEGQKVTLPIMPAKGVFVGPSGRFVELKTVFGLRVRWDGEQQLFVTVSSAYAGKLCGFCGNYDGDSNNDSLKPNGSPALDDEELGNSWQSAEDEGRECLPDQADFPLCDVALKSTISGPRFCGSLMDLRGPFETCLLHLKASLFFDNCVSDLCNFQGLPVMLCAHLSAMTAACQDAGYPVKPWRRPQFCPLNCPSNSRYSLCTSPCPETCHKAFNKPCRGRCVEACECNPGFVLSGLECVPWARCGCLGPTGRYFKLGERWYKPGCKELCVCRSNNRIHCRPWKCQAQEACGHRRGLYGCYAQSSATCTTLGDPHYLTFDGALHHFLGTCTYILTQPCWSKYPENNFVVSASNEIRDGNMEAVYVKAVHVWVLDLRISLIKGRRVMLNGHQVALPVWLLQGRVTISLSGSFILLYTNSGLQVRYDGNHLVEVTVTSSYAGQLCGLCGNYNNNSLDDNLGPDGKPMGSSSQLGAAWRSLEGSEPGCFVAGTEPSSCPEDDKIDTWSKNCEILTNPLGPFSNCHQLVPPQASFVSCVQGQCGSNGDSLALCRSLHAYASLCALAGQVLAWRNDTFCPLRCPPNSTYSSCARPCPPTCLSLSNPKDCLTTLPCTEGCECWKGHILSGTSCVPLNQCGCIEPQGFYHPVGESWYPDKTCTSRCTCLAHNNITCRQATCQENQVCWLHNGLLSCWAPGAGVCRALGDFKYVGFDSSSHLVQNACAHILVKVCHPNMDLPVFKISTKSEGRTGAFNHRQVYIEVANVQIILQEGHQVLINGTPVTLPATSQITGLSITSSGIYTMVHLQPGVQVKFDGHRFLEIKVPMAYYGKVCGVCGNFNGEEEDELMMPSDEPAQDDHEFVDSWRDEDIDSDCQEEDEQAEQTLNGNCRLEDIEMAQAHCQAALQAPAWAKCATRVTLRPFLLDCTSKLCEFGGLSQALCEVLQSFGAACQSEGVKVPVWRNGSFCPLKCPAYSRYTTCTPTCLPSCWDLDGRCEDATVPSASSCAEGCVCQAGYVLNEDKCVPRSHCGCKDAQGGFIPASRTWISRGCTKQCACSEGIVQCWAFHCPPGSHCQDNEDRDSNCVPNKLQHCSIFGDPHYRTFDSRSYHFQGRMTYILVKTVDDLPSGMQPLVVEGRNKMYSPRSPVFLYEVIISVYNYRVQLQYGLVLLVNSQKMALPYRPNKHLRIILRGQRLYLITDFELVISFDGRSSAVISLPRMYQMLVVGLCGNYDGDRKNDFMQPSGMLTRSISAFGKSWEVKNQETLLRVPRAFQEEEEEENSYSQAGSRCSPEQLALINGTQACGVLGDPQGPFAACHHVVVPEPFQEHCMADLCTTQDPKDQEELRCQVLSGYAILCQEEGTNLASWRDHTGCAMTCPANTVYQSCMTPCPATCANLAAPGECEGPCVEGCASLPGYAYSGIQSLPWPAVAALPMASTTRSGLVAGGAGELSSQVLLCKPFSCSDGEICTLANLTRGCFRESPCLWNPCQNDGQCEEHGSSFICKCELGYGGDLCTEPQDVPAPREKEAPSLVAILLSMLMPVMVLVHVLSRECICKRRKRRKRRDLSLKWHSPLKYSFQIANSPPPRVQSAIQRGTGREIFVIYQTLPPSPKEEEAVFLG